jgi:hypothetical protein
MGRDEPDSSETPSGAADLEIWVESSEPWPTAGGDPSGETRYLILTGGIVVTFAGTAADVYMLFRRAPLLALAMVLLGLVAMILIALAGRRRGP